MKLRVSQIETMEREALVTAWSATFGTPVPKRLSSPFMRRFLAFELQSSDQGGLPKGFGAKLARAEGDRPVAKTPALKPGGRLLREWNGMTHVVDVLEEGFLWNGQCHGSLSAIARAITGARWSGPRFFGIRGNGIK